MQNKSRYKSIIALVILNLLVCRLSGQITDPPFLKYIHCEWVDSVMNSLSQEEKIGQLIWVAGYPGKGISHKVYLTDCVKKNKIGGIVLFQGNSAEQTEIINYLQQISEVPLFFASDGEYGAGMRMSDVIKFPYALTIGAIQDDSLIYSIGKAVAFQYKREGVQVNLAPVADIINNSENQVINYRSFGEDKNRVSQKTVMFMKGLQENGIIAVAKHFPGEGAVDNDTHISIATIPFSKERLSDTELVPFRSLINNGISGVMPGHIWVSSIDTNNFRPATFSAPVVSGLLKNELSFGGLVISDALDMGAVVNKTDIGEITLKALKAGIDILTCVDNPDGAINKIAEAVRSKEISEEALNEKCRKVLAAKFWSGLNRIKRIDEEHISEDISNKSNDALIQTLFSNAITLLRNEDELVPVSHLDRIRVATLAINTNELTLFQKRISDYTQCDNFFADTLGTEKETKILEKLKDYDIVIAGIFETDQRKSAGYGIPARLNEFIEKLNTQNRTIITYFGNPFALSYLESLQKAKSLLLAYQENSYAQDQSAQIIFGATGSKGKLPVSINNLWPVGYGLVTPGGLRMRYGLPENAGLSTERLETKIDSIVGIAFAERAFPGCEIMIARKGVAVFRKCYGYHDYDNRIAVLDGDLYDLASVTKIAATVPALMVLESEGKISASQTLGYYLPELRNSNKGELTLREILAHQAGLTPYINFWKETLRKDGSYRKRDIQTEYSEKFNVEVAPGVFLNRNYKMKMFKEIKKSKTGEKKYLYSDLGFILFPGIIEKISGKQFTDYISERIFNKIGAFDLCFNPAKGYALARIVPTEYDSLFRKQQLLGSVHDEGAAMMGGISGLAGLFATANDLMKLMELFRRLGNYGGEQLISEAILKQYTSVQYKDNNNRRGLGFDKPLLNNNEVQEKDAYPAKGVSAESFGHSGYTGTFVWVDPVNEISYVFLCNRVYPTRNNNRITELNTRTLVLQAVYDSVIK
jgi:beta-N-acetylhexosaminidase